MNENRRAFLRGIAGRSLAVVGLTATAVALAHDKAQVKRAWKYAKPALKSFSPQTTVYAQTTGAGTFTLKGSAQTSSPVMTRGK